MAVVSAVLLPNPNIVFVDLAERVAIEESPIRQFGTDINRISQAKHNYSNLRGVGMNVSLKENSIFKDDIDLNGKIKLDENSATEYTQHAKEMGTIIAGYGNSFKTGEGVVTEANIVCTDFDELFTEPISYYQTYSIDVQNHSYGTGIENFYGNETISFDQSTIDLPNLVHVFSAGNAGNAAPEFGTYAGIEGYANLTGNFKQAKNALVIAALDSTMQHERLTSSGPAYDGRIKPELAAFGAEGSSESAALASGSVAMIHEHYNQIYGVLPNSALVKSLLIAGANEADQPGIDFRTGYGSINLNRSLELIDANWIIESELVPNDQSASVITIPANISEFKVVVSWIDPPANPDDNKALVNDLDLSVQDPNSSMWLPWVLDATPNAELLSAAATRKVDKLNNVEMVTIKNPMAGDYIIRVGSSMLATPNQKFGVAFSLKEANSFDWSFPTASDKLQALTHPRIRWENTYESQDGEVSIKYGSGVWIVIGDVGVSEEQLKIDLPDTASTAQLRMVIGTAEYESDIFSVSQLLEIEVENDCEDAFTLSWKKLSNASEYNIYAYQGAELQQILSTSDTLIKMDKSTFQDLYYGVSPVFQGTEGLRSFATNYSNQSKGCYLESFFVRLADDAFADISMEVNAPYEIDNISIMKSHDNEVETIQSFNPGAEREFLFTDAYTKAGVYFYNTELLLQNGGLIRSDTLEIYYTSEENVVVFPNPLVDEDYINILNDNTGGQIHLIDSQGNQVVSFDLVSNIETLDLSELRKGVYLFRVVHEGRIVSSGKIVRL
jgi:hypothetical protein